MTDHRVAEAGPITTDIPLERPCLHEKQIPLTKKANKPVGNQRLDEAPGPCELSLPEATPKLHNTPAGLFVQRRRQGFLQKVDVLMMQAVQVPYFGQYQWLISTVRGLPNELAHDPCKPNLAPLSPWAVDDSNRAKRAINDGQVYPEEPRNSRPWPSRTGAFIDP